MKTFQVSAILAHESLGGYEVPDGTMIYVVAAKDEQSAINKVEKLLNKSEQYIRSYVINEVYWTVIK